jgi:hypothetical protein
MMARRSRGAIVPQNALSASTTLGTWGAAAHAP